MQAWEGGSTVQAETDGGNDGESGGGQSRKTDRLNAWPVLFQSWVGR